MSIAVLVRVLQLLLRGWGVKERAVVDEPGCTEWELEDKDKLVCVLHTVVMSADQGGTLRR